MTHTLKTWPEYFRAIKDGRKTFEIRKNDRNFQVGDTLLLQEYMPDEGEFTGRDILVAVNYILDGFSGLQDGYVAIGISIIGGSNAL